MSEYKIEGTLSYIERRKFPCPEDGVHVAGKDGWIKGVHSLWLQERDKKSLVPKGQVCFYYRLRDDMGLRIFYSFGWWKRQRENYVKKIFRKHRKLAKAEISPMPHNIVTVALNLNYPREKKHIKCNAYAYEVEHVHYPERAWEMYAQGFPYNWTSLNHALHPQHNPEAFLAWRDEARAKQKDLGLKTHGSYKIGDSCYCTKKRTWQLVDID